MSSNKKPTLYLLCGAPGSGKTYRARQLLASGDAVHHLEADMFFETPDGYCYDRGQLAKAHAWCFGHLLFLINTTRQSIVVANTFSRVWERQAYVKAARECGYRLVLEKMDGRYPNTHGVPEDKVQAFRDRFEDFTSDEMCTEY